MSAGIAIKELQDLKPFLTGQRKVDLRLWDLMVWAAAEFAREGGTLIVTSLWRPRDGSGIHDTDPLRAFDAHSWSLPAEARERIKERAAEAWIYDTDRPGLSVLVRHDVGQGDHFHFQVHPNTIRRG